MVLGGWREGGEGKREFVKPSPPVVAESGGRRRSGDGVGGGDDIGGERRGKC